MTDPLTQLLDSDEFRHFLGWRSTPAEDAELRRVAEQAGVSIADLERLRRRAKRDERWRSLAHEQGFDPDLLAAVSGGSVVPRSSPRQRQAPWWLGLAAAVVAVVGASTIAYLARREQSGSAVVEQPALRTIATARGERLSLRLSDSTLVVLAPASTIRVAATYGKDDRTVQLVGQAAFTVVHDEHRPFIVRAGEVVAKDLGTRFIVRAYPTDSAAEVVVAEGQVAVSRGSSTDSLLLAAGEGSRATANGPLRKTRGVPLDSYFAWTDGQLVLRRMPLREAIPELERWYDVDIVLGSGGLGEKTVSGSFDARQSASEALEAIATALRFDVVQTGPRAYALRARG